MARGRDPFWLNTRRPGACSKCSAAIPKGARAFYYPNDGSLYCSADSCGGAASRDFSAALFDERGY